MAELRTDEEQVQALKQWWNENGKSLLLGIAIALAAVAGWKGWQKQQAAEAEGASITYQNMMDAVVGVLGPQQDEAKLATARHLAGQLKTDFDDTTYAQYAALVLARLAVDEGDLEEALNQLNWVLDHSPEGTVKVKAEHSKARILAEQDQVQQALDLLAAIPETAPFAADRDELKGDLYLKLGDKSKARAAYASAAELAPGPVLDMKINDLATEGS